MLRQSDMYARVKGLGLLVEKTDDGEYRLFFHVNAYTAIGYSFNDACCRQEAEAYYSDDRSDVYATAILMAKRGAA